ncbi:glutathione S-transferase T3-like [Panicum virgatum]|uniref:glutathione S-transferase T3-like n=1 Tax=Panicum virgatum TaxID=38727 RepID=UPI0019D58DC2|nr:glutathione S-transferase T3-like [Panicum virgatum]
MKGGCTSSIGKKQVKVKQSNFSADEDVHLTKWWVAVSTDPVINTGQRREGFWSRITNGYNSNRGPHVEQSLKSLSSRFDHIKEQCAKFSDYYTQILHVNPSGMSDADKTTEALARFASTQKPFMLMHCWKILKDEPKWQDLVVVMSQSGKNNEQEDDCYVTAPSNQGDTEAEPSTPSSGGTKRPPGRDSSKAKKFSFMKEQQVEKSKQMAELANLEKEKLDRQMELEERRLALEARRLAKEERVDESRLLAEEERILNIDLDTCKPSLRVFYKAQQDKILAKYSAPSS